MANAATNTSAKSDYVSKDAEQNARLRSVVEAMLVKGDGKRAMDALFHVIDSLQQDNERLVLRLRAADRYRFGRRSEKLTAEELGQLLLALGGTKEDAKAPNPDVPTPPVEEEKVGQNDDDSAGKPPKKKRKHPGRTKLDASLKRNITYVSVPDDEKDCIHCGKAMETIDHVDHERIEYIPARIEVNVRRCEVVACKFCRQDICTAPRADISGAASQENAVNVGPGASSRRRAGATLFAQLIESKCDDAMPVNRQRDQLSRLGFDAPLNTLYSYWTYATKLLLPVAETVLSYVLGDPIVGVDDTRLDFLIPKEKSRKQRGHLWCFVGMGPLVGFDFTETWCAEDIAPHLAAIDGYIQCDDYKGYGTKMDVGDGAEPQILVPPDRRLGCMMHVRRRFHKAFKAGDKDTAVPIQLIKEIYEVEAEAKKDGLGPPERLALRQRKSVPLLDDFDSWVDEHGPKVRPKSYIGEATTYATGQRPFVRRCFEDGRFEIDNGRVERQIREPAVGRKNYYFSGSPEAAKRLAGSYTLVCSCRNAGIPTRDYLIDVLTQLEGGFPLRRINELRPDVWAANRGLLPPAHQLPQ
jgi:transposase